MSEATRSLGTKLLIGLESAAKPVGGLKSIGSPSISQETIDVTTLDSDGGYREFLGSFKDGGEVSISGFFVPQDNGQAAMYAALETGDVQDFEIKFPPGMKASWKFKGVVTAYQTSSELEDAVSFESTIKVSGKPTLVLGGS